MGVARVFPLCLDFWVLGKRGEENKSEGEIKSVEEKKTDVLIWYKHRPLNLLRVLMFLLLNSRVLFL